MRPAVLALALAGLVAAHAEAPPTPYQLYADGRYDEAVRAGLAQNDAAGFCDAARAVLAQEASRDKPCLDCLQRAESYARRAVAADPKFAAGHIYLAVSLGLEEHIEGPVVARLRRYPDQAKRSLDAALAAEPKSAWALAARGGWNLAIVRGGGRVLADMIYGATLAKGLADFAAAFQAAPDNFVLRYQYALSLSDYDADRFHAAIEDALTRAANGTANTAYERMMRTRAGELLYLFKKGDRDAYATRVRKYQGYP
ncbi:MAG: hypothetical protein KGM97_02330 [Alphaproteobacteria bacterium]|nr:hypothetical protein [Alphaproteobacteria bacterium]MDE2629805.1 hypothetical protein [Alphaproteobacteria bacterium]